MRRKQTFFTALPFLLPSLIGMIIFVFIPITASFFLSMTGWSGMTRVSIFSGFFEFIRSNFIGFANYSEIFARGDIWRVLGNNLYFIVLYIPLMLTFSLLVASIMSAERKGTGVYRVIYYIPVLTSWVAGALIWQWLLSPVYGPINNILAFVGIEGPLWLHSTAWAMPSIAFASVWKDIGFFGMIFLGGLLGISPEYYEAAKIDGAGPFHRLLYVTIPLLSPITFYVVMIAMISSFQLFPQVMIMTGGGPLGATEVMVERIYRYAFSFGRMGYATALSWILFVVIFTFTVIQNVAQKKWVHYD